MEKVDAKMDLSKDRALEEEENRKAMSFSIHTYMLISLMGGYQIDVSDNGQNARILKCRTIQF